MSAVNTTVPETVPLNSQTGVANTVVVVFAGIVKFTCRDPVENCTAGSSLGMTLFAVKVIVSVPDKAFGWGADNDNPIGICWAGVIVSGTLTKENEPTGGATTEIVKALVAFKVELSATCIVKVK